MLARWASDSAIQLSFKLLIAIFGGYVFTSGYVAFSTVLLVKLGMQMGEAVVLNTMLGFIVYLCLMLWIFATTKLWQTSGIIILIAVAMIVVSPYLAESL